MAKTKKQLRKEMNQRLQDAQDALVTKIGSTGETAQNRPHTWKEYDLITKDPTEGHYNPKLHTDLGDKHYGTLHDAHRMEVDQNQRNALKLFKNVIKQKKKKNRVTRPDLRQKRKNSIPISTGIATGGTVRMKSGGPVVDSYDYD
jgi:hypothetical protein